MKEKLEGILDFDPTVESHLNWKNHKKQDIFYDSFCYFYLEDFTDNRKKWMENNELGGYVFVGLDFIGIGKTDSNEISVIPYSTENEFTDILFDMLIEYNSIAVFIPKESNELTELVERASERLNAEYDGDVMEYSYEKEGELMYVNGEIKPAEKGNIVLTGYWERKAKAEKFIEEFVKESGIPFIKFENIDGSILYSFTANSNYGPMYGFELTESGFLEPKFSRCESFDIPTENPIGIVGVPSNEGTIWVIKQDNIPYKN